MVVAPSSSVTQRLPAFWVFAAVVISLCALEYQWTAVGYQADRPSLAVPAGTKQPAAPSQQPTHSGEGVSTVTHCSAKDLTTLGPCECEPSPVEVGEAIALSACLAGNVSISGKLTANQSREGPAYSGHSVFIECGAALMRGNSNRCGIPRRLSFEGANTVLLRGLLFDEIADDQAGEGGGAVYLCGRSRVCFDEDGLAARCTPSSSSTVWLLAVFVVDSIFNRSASFSPTALIKSSSEPFFF